MKDVQSQQDLREIDIDQVGITDIIYPIVVWDRAKGQQSTIAKIDMSVNLPHNFRGTHMSRFVEVLENHKDRVGIESVGDILDEMKERLEAQKSRISLTFTYFMEKTAPVSKLVSHMNYECNITGELGRDNIKDYVCTVAVPVLTLCPCSKEISKYGAHNQRSTIRISVRTKRLVWIEELIEFAERSASSPVYALLKRDDEKYVTESSYENPAFVEDVVRNVTELLDNDSRVEWFAVSSTNMESIHNHSAWATITRDKRDEKGENAGGEEGVWSY